MKYISVSRNWLAAGGLTDFVNLGLVGVINFDAQQHAGSPYCLLI